MDVNLTSERRGEPVAMMPGLMCDSRMFSGVAESVPDVVFPARFYPGATTIEAMAELALSGLPERFALLGHSMGARIALEMWRRSPERITRLALVDTGTHDVRAGEREARYALRDAGRACGIEKLVDSWLPPMVAPQNRGDRSLMGKLRAMVRDAGQGTYERQIEALLTRPRASAVLGTITCPTFVVVGERDAWSPVAQHVSMAAEIQNSQLRIIPSAGHMAPAECPEEFLKIVQEWLAWRPPAPR